MKEQERVPTINCRYCNNPATYVISAQVEHPYVCGIHKNQMIRRDIKVIGLAKSGRLYKEKGK